MIFFDLDGTLMDHDASERAGAIALWQRFAPPTGQDEFARHWSDCLERQFPRYLAGEITLVESRRIRCREILDSRLSDGDADQAYAHYLEVYQSTWSLYDDVQTALQSLPGRLGIITNGEGGQQRRKLKSLGIESRFETIVVSSEVGAAKPDPRIFQAACRIAGIEPQQATYVGDRLDIDARAAKDIGMRGIWLNRRGEPPARDVLTIESLRSLG